MAQGSRSQEAISPTSASKSSLMSSQSSSRSMASLTPSMSPSSIISLQRTARHEKKHVLIGLHQNTPSKATSSTSSQKGQNRSAVLYTKAQKRQQQKDKNNGGPATVKGAITTPITAASAAATTAAVISTPSEKPTKGGISRVSAKNRFSKWASSLHQVLSSSAHHAASSPLPPPPTTLPPPPHRAAASPSLSSSSLLRAVVDEKVEEKMEHSSRAQAPTLAKKGPVHADTDAIGSQAKLLDTNSFSSSASSFKQPRVRIISQSRRRKIGSGLITVFCIIAVVILVLC